MDGWRSKPRACRVYLSASAYTLAYHNVDGCGQGRSGWERDEPPAIHGKLYELQPPTCCRCSSRDDGRDRFGDPRIKWDALIMEKNKMGRGGGACCTVGRSKPSSTSTRAGQTDDDESSRQHDGGTQPTESSTLSPSGPLYNVCNRAAQQLVPRYSARSDSTSFLLA